MEQCDRFLNKSCMYGRTVGRSVELPVRWSIDWSHKYMSKLLPDHQIQSNKPNQNGLLNQKAQSLDSNGQTSTTTPTTLGQLNEWMTVAMVMNVMAEGRTDRQTVTRLLDLRVLVCFEVFLYYLEWEFNMFTHKIYTQSPNSKYSAGICSGPVHALSCRLRQTN